jgi:hypothetical protein
VRKLIEQIARFHVEILTGFYNVTVILELDLSRKELKIERKSFRGCLAEYLILKKGK